MAKAPPFRMENDGGGPHQATGDARRPYVTAHVLHCLRAVCIAAEHEARQAQETWYGVSLPTVLRARAFVDDYEAYRRTQGQEVRHGPVPTRSYDFNR